MYNTTISGPHSTPRLGMTRYLGTETVNSHRLEVDEVRIRHQLRMEERLARDSDERDKILTLRQLDDSCCMRRRRSPRRRRQKTYAELITQVQRAINERRVAGKQDGSDRLRPTQRQSSARDAGEEEARCDLDERLPLLVLAGLRRAEVEQRQREGEEREVRWQEARNQIDERLSLRLREGCQKVEQLERERMEREASRQEARNGRDERIALRHRDSDDKLARLQWDRDQRIAKVLRMMECVDTDGSTGNAESVRYCRIHRILRQFDLQQVEVTEPSTPEIARQTVIDPTRPDKCAVCLSSLDDEETQTLQCCHKFHCIFIEQWLQEKVECPVCRREVHRDSID